MREKSKKMDGSLEVCVGFWFPLDQELTLTKPDG